MDPVPEPLLLRISGSTGNRTRTSGTVARKSDHYTTEAIETIAPYQQILVSRLFKHNNKERFLFSGM
jgi:hypothetical protein